ncbi:Outer membrane protein assembly factor BamD [Posidoniimonas corsicana]|uniref:Outer membrane protein assembly factor BamD n=1 Tax=Posidoniimonas corsicana TaxID=1938618 RepID=A0A5C5VJL6_9BACT|nr:tetratricopeptide repeat protein [Posidoniimonas corsicana]TWT38183.1 Outer membrane protein assembly factor BamD [Posidoniimonas corsicana]
MSKRPHLSRPLAFGAAVLLACLSVASPSARAIDWPFLGGGDDAPAQAAGPGTEDWWKRNKKKAIMTPGKGFQVPGYEGYFDAKGRPMDAPADEVIDKLVEDDKPAGLLPALDPKIGINNIKKAVGQGPSAQAAQQALDAGKALFQQEEYAKAEDQFEAAANALPGSQIEAEALFLLGESYFWQNKYVDARDTFNDLVSKHPNTRHLDTLVGRQWVIAQYWERHYFDYKQTSRLRPNLLDGTRPTFDTIGQAVNTYDNIRLNDPTGPWADDAIMATASIYFRQNRYGDADYHYSLLRKEYPRSEHQFNAHILGLQAKLRKYQGADYDGTVLEEAKALLKQIRTQFAGRLTDEEKERLRNAQAEVAKATEERDLRMAEYYDKTSHYGAARQYYARISQKYGSSPVAQQARERLAEIGGEPSHPDRPLEWLVDWFPESKERSIVNQIPELRRDAETRIAEAPSDSTTR